MSSFSIDDVRESFTADVSLFLTRIQRAAQGALEASALKPDLLAGDGRPAFQSLVDLAHAIYGTAALVDAGSLRDSARVLEELAGAGVEAVRQIEEASARARAVASACAEGVTRMRRMLFVELGHRGDDAMRLATEWLTAVETLRQSVVVAPAAALIAAPLEPLAVASAPAADAPEAPTFAFADGSDGHELAEEPIAAAADEAAPEELHAEPEAAAAASASASEEESFQFGGGEDSIAEEPVNPSVGFSFEDRSVRIIPATAAAQMAAPADEPAPVSEELVQIFRAEGHETVRALAEELGTLRAQPDDMASVGNLERLFHTLKGAAVTVGLTSVSRAAAAIQERLEAELESGSGLSAATVELLIGETTAMLASAGLPALAMAAPAAGAGSAANARSSAHAFFLQEVEELQREASGLVEELGSTSAETAIRARDELGKLFHRLKGSAILVGESKVSSEAEKLQAIFDPEGSTGTVSEDLAPTAQAALARIAKLLGTGRPATAAAPAAAKPASTELVREKVSVTAEKELWEAFSQESGELIEALERESLALEESSQPRQVLEKSMNIIHTLKGVLNTIGLSPTAKELHRVEDFLEGMLKAPILPPMRGVASLLLKVKSDVRRNLGEAKRGWVETSLPRLEARIAKVLLGARTKAEAGNVNDRPSVVRGGSVHSIADARSQRHSAFMSMHTEVANGSARNLGPDAADRKFIRVGTERFDSLMNLAGELVVSRARLLDRVGNLKKLQNELGRGSRRLVDTVDEFRDNYEFASLDGKGKKRVPQIAAAAPAPAAAPADPASPWESFGELEMDRYEDVHILSRRLAEIVNDVTELQGQLSRGLGAFGDESQAFEAIVSGIQSEVSRARMVPLDLLFSRLRLPVRDAATREGKEVRVVTEGAEVLIDKTVADGLFAPMLHLVRNSVVHGIEPVGARSANGKPVVGVITLAARQESGQIVIEVRDDGAGLDLEALRARGVKLGRVTDATPLTDQAVRDLVFIPGLSTRPNAGAVSGRGVGCDVVRRSVERMNGTISVDTDAGKGARFTITLPVTLAITKALLVRQNQRLYAFPLHFAERIIDPEGQKIVESAGSRRIKIDDTFIGVTRFGKHLRAGAGTDKGPVLLLRVGDQRSAVQVDAVVGQEEVVVKGLGDVLDGHPLFAGITMRGSGELALIVDVPGLMETRARRGDKAPAAGEGKPARQKNAVRDTAAAAPVPAKKQRVRALFVDDSLSVRKYAEMMLGGMGVDVQTAVDGVDALARLRGQSFDIVFTDLEMPRMHGFELIRELRFVPAYRDLPIVVVTSRSGQKHRQQARAVGATEYLTKPFSAQAVAEILEKFNSNKADDVKPAPGHKS